jgi:S1-C subfamily serine protease
MARLCGLWHVGYLPTSNLQIETHMLKKTTMAFLIIIFSPVLMIKPINANDSIKNSVLKVYSTFMTYDYDMPWNTWMQDSVQGSGFIINDKRVLTSAHIVADQIFVQVRKFGEAEKFRAEVEDVSHDRDLAVLSVKDNSFFNNTKPIKIGNLVDIGDEVTTYGYPQGGDKLTSTSGIVSRVEHIKYKHSRAKLLASQVDASMNPGSSGGPVINNGHLVGVAFMGAEGDSINYMVPTPVISHFLKDIKNGKPDGIPTLGIQTQKIESPYIKAKLGMDDDLSGVLINNIYYNSPATDILNQKDVLLAIDGQNIANDKTIEFREDERTFFEYPIQKKYINDYVNLKILRDQQIKNIQVKLTKSINYQRLVPHIQYDVAPTYYIIGGLVFAPLTENYLRTWGKSPYKDAPNNLLYYFKHGEKNSNQKEVIVLNKVLADDVNVGYHHLKNKIVATVNGNEISTMESMVKAFEKNKNKYHIIKMESGIRIILNRNHVESRENIILNRFNINSDRSDELKNYN